MQSLLINIFCVTAQMQSLLNFFFVTAQMQSLLINFFVLLPKCWVF